MNMKQERLEYLGDRVLELIMVEWLFLRFPHESEADLDTRRVRLVSKPAVAEVARQKWPNASFTNDKAACDTMEASIASVYLEKGLVSAKSYIRKVWDETMKREPAKPTQDAKSALQTLGRGQPVYTVLDRSGPDHEPHFSVVCHLGDNSAKGSGRTKKIAETAAAMDLLTKLGITA